MHAPYQFMLLNCISYALEELELAFIWLYCSSSLLQGQLLSYIDCHVSTVLCIVCFICICLHLNMKEKLLSA